MCIIVYHPKNAKPISKETLKICFTNNDDGAGYTFWNKTKNKWIIRKGFMEWKDFWESFSKKDFQSNSIWVAHFRIGTSGKIDGSNTHPFPVCNNYRIMKKTKYETDVIAAHNGIMSKGEEDFSDTMKHIKEILFPLRNKLNKKEFLNIFEMLCDSSSNRWFLADSKTTLLFGEWKKFEGSYYSNTSYEKVKAWKSTHNSTKHYGHDYGYYDNWYNKCNIPKNENNTNENSECPSCGEKEFVDESLFSNFKLRCFRCGAVFDPITNNISFFVPVNERAF